ncbi:MAG: STAS domain-containing protein [Candidatus Sericytochromatia bacterium]|nr:STAS domain-containing protein [Candidatus Sericytochromatia bacterium]
MAFEVVRQEHGGTPVLKLHGELDTVSATQLDRALDDMAIGVSRVWIDLSELDYINSTGVRCFLRIVRQLRGAGGDLAFLAAPAKIERVFQYCGLSGYFRFYADAPAAAGLAR